MRTSSDYYPQHARSLVNLADIAQAEGDSEQAQRLLLQAVAAEPDRAYPASFLGRFLQQQGQLGAAQAAYERALAIEEDAETRYRLGLLWLQQGQISEAHKQFAKAVERDPNEVKSLYQLALLALQSGEDTQAIHYLQRLTFLTPRNAEVFMRLGKLYLQRGQLATAALYFWEARDLQPDLPDVQRLLQQVYEALQQEQR